MARADSTGPSGSPCMTPLVVPMHVPPTASLEGEWEQVSKKVPKMGSVRGQGRAPPIYRQNRRRCGEKPRTTTWSGSSWLVTIRRRATSFGSCTDLQQLQDCALSLSHDIYDDFFRESARAVDLPCRIATPDLVGELTLYHELDTPARSRGGIVHRPSIPWRGSIAFLFAPWDDLSEGRFIPKFSSHSQPWHRLLVSFLVVWICSCQPGNLQPKPEELSRSTPHPRVAVSHENPPIPLPNVRPRGCGLPQARWI